jgi:hypothetical protein
MGSQELPPSQKSETMAQLHRDLIYIAQHINDPQFSFTFAGGDDSGDLEVAYVDVSAPGVSLRWLVNPQTGKVIGETYKAMGKSGPVDSETSFSDWKQVEGLNLPFHRDNMQGGQNSSSVQFTTIQLNPAVDPKIFEKLAASAQ